jgi:hypothetical protein
MKRSGPVIDRSSLNKQQICGMFVCSTVGYEQADNADNIRAHRQRFLPGGRLFTNPAPGRARSH